MAIDLLNLLSPVEAGSAVGVALIAARQLFGLAPKRLEDSVLTGPEQELVCAVADTFFPPAGPIPVSGTEAGLLEYFDAYVRNSDRLQATLIHLLLTFTDMSPLLFGPRFARFSNLSDDDKLTFLQGAFTSNIYFRRISFVSIRAVMTMAYLSNDAVAKVMEMDNQTDPFGIGDTVYEVRPEGQTA